MTSTAPGPLRHHRQGVLMVLGGIVSVQIGSSFAKGLFAQAGPGGVVFLRLVLAAVLLLLVARPALRLLRGVGGRQAITFGVCLGGMNWSFYEALARIPLGVAVTIEFVGPLGVAVATSRRRGDVALAGLAAAGIILLTRSGSVDLDPVGIVLALVAGGFWAAYILLSARVGASLPGSAGLAIALLAGSLVTAPVGVTSLWGSLTWGLLLAGAGVALLSSAIPYSLELEALRRIPTSLFGVLMSLEPAMAALAGWVVLDERLGARQWLAISLVVVASAMAALRAPQAAAPHLD
ncbi:MAG: EamA family transporter [Nocardioidaceae bacterium]